MDLFADIRWQDLVDVLIVTFMAYRVWVWIRGTKALQILVGLLALALVSLLAVRYDLATTAWIFSNLWTVLLVLILIVFQPELRRMLERVSPLKLLTGKPTENGHRWLQEIRDAAFQLGADRTGALMVLAREDSVDEHVSDGIQLDGLLTRQVLVSLFQRSSPVHDGAVVIRGDRILSVGNYLPLTERAGLPQHLGTRHRSALGLSEVCDALVVVVSEERGEVAVALGGDLVTCREARALEAELRLLLVQRESPARRSRRRIRVLAGDPLGKFGALAFAGILWSLFAAPHDYQRIIPDVPIDYRFSEGVAGIGAMEQQAAITVSGNRAALGRLRPEELSLSVDLSILGKGNHIVNLEEVDVVTPPGVHVVSVQPHKIQVYLDEVETRAFPIAVRRRGNLNPSWTLQNLSAEPENVELTGLSSELDRVSWVETEPVDLAGKTGTWVGLMDVSVRPAGISLDVQPGQVEVRLRAAPDGG